MVNQEKSAKVTNIFEWNTDINILILVLIYLYFLNQEFTFGYHEKIK